MSSRMGVSGEGVDGSRLVLYSVVAVAVKFLSKIFLSMVLGPRE